MYESLFFSPIDKFREFFFPNTEILANISQAYFKWTIDYDDEYSNQAFIYLWLGPCPRSANN